MSLFTLTRTPVVTVEQGSDGRWYAVPLAEEPNEWPVGAAGETEEQARAALAGLIPRRPLSGR